MPQAMRDNLILAGVLAALTGATTALVYVPQQRRLSDLRTRVAQEKLELAEDAKRAATVPDMLRQVQDMRKRYSNFDRRLPKRKELGEFLREISGNLSAEQLSNQLIEPGSPSRASLFHTFPITLRFRGGYLSLASFLNRLEQMERLTQVHRLLIRGKDLEQGDGVGPLEIELLMNIYFTES